MQEQINGLLIRIDCLEKMVTYQQQYLILTWAILGVIAGISIIAMINYVKTTVNKKVDQELIQMKKDLEEKLIGKIGKISITTSKLSYNGTDKDPNWIATYDVYDQYGNKITAGSLLNNNLTFKSQVGTVTGNNGLLTIRDLKDDYLKRVGTVLITIEDKITGVSGSATLEVLDCYGIPVFNL